MSIYLIVNCYQWKISRVQNYKLDVVSDINNQRRDV